MTRYAFRLTRQRFFRLQTFSILFAVTFLLISPLYATAARPLNAIQLAVGEWEVSMQGGWWMDASQIFPTTKIDNVRHTADGRKFPTPYRLKRRPWGSSLQCSLSLASDGSFVMLPKSCTGVETITSSDASGILLLRGRWLVHANPYCITDRFYDTVTLVSYPHQKILVRTSGKSSKGNDVLQTVQMNINCRLWGRHQRRDGGVWRRTERTAWQEQQQKQQRKLRPYEVINEAVSAPTSTAVGRMTHGTLVWKELLPPSSPWWRRMKPRPILASFSAKRRSREPAHEGWFDKERYGY